MTLIFLSFFKHVKDQICMFSMEKSRLNLQDSGRGSSSRRGRSYRGSRPARTSGFRSELARAVASAPVIDGVRLPDDETDAVVHRNGRFVNNVFVADERQVVPPEFTVSSGQQGYRLVTRQFETRNINFAENTNAEILILRPYSVVSIVISGGRGKEESPKERSISNTKHYEFS